MKIISVNIATKTMIPKGKKMVPTGIFKKPVNQITLGYEHVEGDVVSDRKVHGGENKAVYGYSKKHYAFWRNQYPIVAETPGFFGENITFDELDETLIRIGNQYQCNDVIIEVAEPRYPCYKLGHVFGTPNIIKDFMNSDKSGIYFKVIQPGILKPEDQFTLIKEVPDNPTIAQVVEAKRSKK